MALFEIEVESNIVDVAFGRENSMFGVLHQKGFAIFLWQTSGQRSTKPILAAKHEFEGIANGDGLGLPVQIGFSGSQSLQVLIAGEETRVHTYQLDVSSKTIQLENVQNAENIVAISSYEDDDDVHVYGQDRTGGLFRLGNDAVEDLPSRSPVQLPWSTITDINGNLAVIGLSRNGHLYADSKLLVKNCTSFLVTPAHLIFTTNNHFLKFIHLTDVEGKLVISDSKPRAASG
jgi:elongator complex protein 1